MGDLIRCPWVDLNKPDYVAYHDREWGVPVRDDRTQFEFLILEGAQAGLSWYTVLRKRENYRQAFAGFDPHLVAGFGPDKVEQMLQNPGLIRNRLKLESAITNARKFLEVQAEFGSFSDYIWGFVDGEVKVNTLRTMSDYPATSKESDVLSKDLKRRGFKFVGSTIIYAHLQATGLVNDHTLDCFRRAELLC
ncbi:MAG TPA: DNA-3-methyladenine glycosylase I [Geothermobacteraceae bacterium]|nr:DNA-3-methyladenine glycosylase I [Geothermobacteraceae bacterium]